MLGCRIKAGALWGDTSAFMMTTRFLLLGSIGTALPLPWTAALSLGFWTREARRELPWPAMPAFNCFIKKRPTRWTSLWEAVWSFSLAAIFPFFPSSLMEWYLIGMFPPAGGG